MNPCARPARSSVTDSAARARLDDWSIAPPTPWTKRARTSCTTVWDKPQSQELTEKTKKPSANIFSRPHRSEMRPKMTERPIFESWYDNNAHDTPSKSVPKLCATVGMDMLTILVAVPEKNVPNSAVVSSR